MYRITFCLIFLLVIFKAANGKSLLVNDVAGDDGIIGGNDVDIKQYPYQVSIVFKEKVLHCGGSIISEEYVLTAAHCFLHFHSPKLFKIRAGSTFFSKNGETYNILSIIVHPKFSGASGDYDVAIIKTERMDLNGVTRIAVQLAKANRKLKVGKSVIVTGWGLTMPSGNQSTRLQALSMPVVSTERCEQPWKALYNRTITDRMFCAGFYKPGHSTCHGDSGGPVVSEASLKQYGIVSFGTIWCDEPGVPGVFVNIPAVRGWVKKITGI